MRGRHCSRSRKRPSAAPEQSSPSRPLSPEKAMKTRHRNRRQRFGPGSFSTTKGSWCCRPAAPSFQTNRHTSSSSAAPRKTAGSTSRWTLTKQGTCTRPGSMTILRQATVLRSTDLLMWKTLNVSEHGDFNARMTVREGRSIETPAPSCGHTSIKWCLIG